MEVIGISFPDAWLSELMSRTDIASVVSEYVSLKPRGGRLWGCCPFHNEKTPSFSVTTDKQFYYCFGCKKGGTVIKFIQEIENVPFTDAVKMLAERAGMELPQNVDEKGIRQNREEKEKLYEVCREAALYFHAQLKSPEGRAAQGYLVRRGLSPNTAAEFGLGYAPDRWDALYDHLKAKGFEDELMVKAGLVSRSKKDEKRFFDWFRGRVVYPIIGGYNRVIGFGARTMDPKGQPKYLNSPETLIFSKRSNLYGLNRLKGKNPGRLILVEGYMDVISLHEHGVINAVATLGTALTPEQARLIKRYAPEVIVAYDGDFAGQKAIYEALKILEAEGLKTKVLAFPNGQDPDEFIRDNGKSAFEDMCANAQSKNSFRLRYLAKDYDLNTPDGREAFAKAGAAMVARLSPVEQDRYYNELSLLTGFRAEVLMSEGSRATLEAPVSQKNTPASYRDNRSTEITEKRQERGALDAETLLIRLAAENGGYLSRMKEDGIVLEAPGAAELLDCLATGEDYAAGLSDEASALLAAALSLPESEQPDKCYAECVEFIKNHRLEQELAALQKLAADETVPASERLKALMRIGELSSKTQAKDG